MPSEWLPITGLGGEVPTTGSHPQAHSTPKERDEVDQVGGLPPAALDQARPAQVLQMIRLK